MLNSFSGIGRLRNDPVVKKDGEIITANFDLVMNEFFRKDKEIQKRTHYIPCVAFGRLAEVAGEFLRKGSHVGIRGALKQDSVTHALQIHIDELEFLASSPSSANEQPF